MGIHASASASRREALEPVRQGVRRSFGAFGKVAAKGLKIRHNHGSQSTSKDFQREIRFPGAESSPAFVRAPEGNGCAERFDPGPDLPPVRLRLLPGSAELEGTTDDGTTEAAGVSRGVQARGDRTSGLTIVAVARELDVHETLLRRWITRCGEPSAKRGGAPAAAGGLSSADPAAETARLKRGLQRARVERGILEKAALAIMPAPSPRSLGPVARP